MHWLAVWACLVGGWSSFWTVSIFKADDLVASKTMGRLIYHNLTGISGQDSPFDEAILEVARFGSVSIVSPYIGVDYLDRIIQVSPTWRLITDIEAWLSSLSMRARPKAWLFIRENLPKIHHCPAIHAKTVISQELAMIGSANLTNTGILNRTEMGILIDEPKMVAELNTWFDAIWHQTLPPIADETNSFVQWLDEEAARSSVSRERFSLSASSKKIRSRLVKLIIAPIQKKKDAALNLGSVAQSLILEEQNHYKSLDEAMQAAIDHLAKNEFSLGLVVANVRLVFPSASIREIYFSLLQHCANHERSVFMQVTKNRLILSNGKFTQSTQEDIFDALAPFDLFLVELIHHFDFNEIRSLPSESGIVKRTGIGGDSQVVLFSALSECGFLDLEDAPGRLPRYKLSWDFEWTGRYKLFIKAMHDWTAKKERPSPRFGALVPINKKRAINKDNEISLNKILYDNFEDDEANPDWGQNLVTGIKSANAELSQMKIEHRKEVDKVMAHFLRRLIAGEKLEVNKELAQQISKEIQVRNQLIWLIISGEGRGMPKVISPVMDLRKRQVISINPSLDWKDLAHYPLTQNACKTFLGV